MAEKAPRRAADVSGGVSASRCRAGRRTFRRRSTTRWSPSPIPTATCSPGAAPGASNFKGSRKSTPYAAQVTAEIAARKAMEHGVRQIEVYVRGPGAGREAAIRALQALACRWSRSPM